MGAHSSTQIPSVVIDFPSAAEFSNLWGGGRDAPPRPPAIYVPGNNDSKNMESSIYNKSKASNIKNRLYKYVVF